VNVSGTEKPSGEANRPFTGKTGISFHCLWALRQRRQDFVLGLDGHPLPVNACVIGRCGRDVGCKKVRASLVPCYHSLTLTG